MTTPQPQPQSEPLPVEPPHIMTREQLQRFTVQHYEALASQAAQDHQQKK